MIIMIINTIFSFRDLSRWSCDQRYDCPLRPQNGTRSFCARTTPLALLWSTRFRFTWLFSVFVVTWSPFLGYPRPPRPASFVCALPIEDWSELTSLHSEGLKEIKRLLNVLEFWAHSVFIAQLCRQVPIRPCQKVIVSRYSRRGLPGPLHLDMSVVLSLFLLQSVRHCLAHKTSIAPFLKILEISPKLSLTYLTIASRT